METTSAQSLYYSNAEALDVEDVAESLLAFKGLVELTPELLRQLFPSISVQSVSVSVDSITTGSLLEDLIVKLVWGNQEELNKDTEKLRTTLHLRELFKNKKFVAALIFALICGGGIYALRKLSASEPQKQVIQGNQNNVVIVASQLSGLPSQVIEAAVTNVIADNPQAARDALRVVGPAKREEGATLSAGKQSDVGLSAETVRAMPVAQPIEEGVDSIEDMGNVELQIRATDLDSTKRGWAAIVPALGDRRLKVHLDVGVPPTRLVGKASVRADITVVYRRDASGERLPVLVYVRKIRR